MDRVQLIGQTTMPAPALHIWRDDGFSLNLKGKRLDRPGEWWRFSGHLDRSRAIHFKLFDLGADGTAQVWERAERTLSLDEQGRLPSSAWFAEGTDRAIPEDPFAVSYDQVTVHLITARRYRGGEIYLWTPGGPGETQRPAGEDQWGPYYVLTLDGERRHLFHFKFISAEQVFEADYANRTWSSTDGPEIWTHSEGAAVLRGEPCRQRLTVHLGHEWGDGPIWMHIWQAASDFAEFVPIEADQDPGWATFARDGLYTGIPYGLMFTTHDPLAPRPDALWEDDAAQRTCVLSGDEECWTLEGDPAMFEERPARDQVLVIHVAARDPQCPVQAPSALEARVNHARAFLCPQFEQRADGSWLLWTYAGVTTSFRFRTDDRAEPVEHRLALPAPTGDESGETEVSVVLGRAPILRDPLPAALFQDPSFWIQRPGVVERDGHLEFAFHAPWCARVRLWGEWMSNGDPLPDLYSTRDGTFWWLRVPVDEVSVDGTYHGMRYQFVLNDIRGDAINDGLNGAKTVQDPAAGWVETSDPSGHSRLVDHARYGWQSWDWQTPGWEYLQVYQLHPSRFTRRHEESGQPLPPLSQVTREIEADGGYLRQLGITALLLMPLTEFEGRVSWGYNPSYFYAVEEAYGGPDALKELVDVCHQNGIAVLLDVVFNHAGTGHNILWEVSRDTYIDGDTQWGALINFDHPQCLDFFAKNLLYWMEVYRVDGFRFDHTKTIIEGHTRYDFVRRPGSGGGWEFLHAMRHAVKTADPRCLLMAEQLPNDWALTNAGGPMDTQWSDDFHDRLVDLCRGDAGQMDRFVDALQISQVFCQQWYNVTNYSESHDEVGNVNDRIAQSGGFGRGLRLNKVAAAATLMSRGIPLLFMGEEAGETRQFRVDADDTLDLDAYEDDEAATRVRRWWQELFALRRNNPKIQGAAPLQVHWVEGPLVAFSRGSSQEFFVILNLSPSAITRSLGHMNLPGASYRELWNSTWPAFQVEWEDEHGNGGRDAYLHRDMDLNIPDYGVVILERI